jgi:hypothetical protein
MRPAFVRGLTCQGWGTSRGFKGGSAPLARSYRGPDNVAGPILGLLTTVHPVVSSVSAPLRLARPDHPQRKFYQSPDYVFDRSEIRLIASLKFSIAFSRLPPIAE